MSMIDHTSNVLAALSREFPLAARLESLPDEVHDTYGRIIAEWYAGGTAPRQDRFNQEHLTALAQADAVVLTPRGIGCYPFSATPTDIRVRYRDHTCHAMCAIDALAIPCIIGTPAEIEAICKVCRSPLSIKVDPTTGPRVGRRKDVAITHSGVAVLYTPSPGQHEVCCKQLCPNIVFVCEECLDPREPRPLSVAAATVVGSEFFAFQRALLPAKTISPIGSDAQAQP